MLMRFNDKRVYLRFISYTFKFIENLWIFFFRMDLVQCRQNILHQTEETQQQLHHILERINIPYYIREILLIQDLELIIGTLKLPERALESFWFIPFNLSHLRKSLSNMEMSNVTLCACVSTLSSLAAGTCIIQNVLLNLCVQKLTIIVEAVFRKGLCILPFPVSNCHDTINP